MRYPAFLLPQDTIGLVAPSYGPTIEPYCSLFQEAKKNLQIKSFHYVEGPNCTKNEGIGISSSPENCGTELNEMYLRQDVQAIWSTGGGEMMCEVVPFIDFSCIKSATPKWYIGYSDNTNFIFPSTILADTAAIYAPCFCDLGMKPSHSSIQDLFDILCGKKQKVSNYDLFELNKIKDLSNPYQGYHLTEPFQMKKYPDTDIQFSGRLVGGCLDCIVNLLGTPYGNISPFLEKYKEDGIIWFLESCDLNVFSMRRAIWEMKESGCFQYVKGFLFGRPYAAFDESFLGLDSYRAVEDLLKEYQVPILMDLDIGHRPPAMPIVSGALAHVKTQGNHIEIKYNFI